MPDLNSIPIVADAISLGKQSLSDTRDAAVSLLTKLETDVTTAVPHANADLVASALAWIPQTPGHDNPTVAAVEKLAEAYLGGYEHTLSDKEVALVKAGFGVAITRISALL